MHVLSHPLENASAATPRRSRSLSFVVVYFTTAFLADGGSASDADTVVVI